MVNFLDLQNFFASQNYKVVIASDGETRKHTTVRGEIVEEIPAGGVAVTLDPVAFASQATYIARGKTPEDKKVLTDEEYQVTAERGSYTLKRVFISERHFHEYYEGFANQTLWPLCHVAFEQPLFDKTWFEGFKHVNQKFAESVKEEIKGKTFIWINDYQLCLVPKYLQNQKNSVVALFWHIPWPTWEAFRILPQKKEILESLLMCDFLAFHRGYHARNFLETVKREFETRIDEETGKVYYNGHVTTVMNLPLGIDTDVVQSLVDPVHDESHLVSLVRKVFHLQKTPTAFDSFFIKNKVILGVDRLDYTKGLSLRLQALDRFFEKHTQYVGKAVYLGLLAPSRQEIPAYKKLKEEIDSQAEEINKKYARRNWKPIHLVTGIFPRKELVNFYSKADLCLVTPRDDGMNLVSKEFVVASALLKNPGVLVLSQFAGSAIDLTSALIVNPYDIDEVVSAMKKGLEMEKGEKILRMKKMAETLDEYNVYNWAELFVKQAIAAKVV